jgi:hypothetical protein
MVYRSKGGPDTEENLLTLCVVCHNAHHDGFLSITWGEQGANGDVKFMRQRGWKP